MASKRALPEKPGTFKQKPDHLGVGTRLTTRCAYLRLFGMRAKLEGEAWRLFMSLSHQL